MPSAVRWKFSLFAFFLALACLVMYPTVYKDAPDWYKKYVVGDGLKLGLDLQGGMHLIMEVDVDQAIKNATELAAKDLKDMAAGKQITMVRKSAADAKVATKAASEVEFMLPNPDAFNQIKKIIKDELPSVEVVREDATAKFPVLVVRLSSKEEGFLRQNAVDQSLEIIRNRIDQFGVAEPSIVRQGDKQIVIQLPGVRDTERALKLVGQTAQLEFKLVDDAAGVDVYGLVANAIKDGRLSADYDANALQQALKDHVPSTDVVSYIKEKNEETGKETKRPILLKANAAMTGEAVKTANVQIGGTYNEPYVSLVLTDRGAKLFEKLTEESVGKRLAIVLDGVTRSAPVIRERIGGGQAQISGSFTTTEASDLAIVLRAGALPAPVKIIQNVTVGPSLGADSIEKGLMSGLIGAAIVLLFMAIYYRFSGVVADVAVALNILFLLAVLSLFHATLTLPGIAGIILTVGMGVDSNVLIFERMREERAKGKPLKAFIDSGYDRAFLTIIDAHVTTLITALALFLFGTGPIKGFAVSLSAGIVINLFTAIFCTRIVYDWRLAGTSFKDVSFMQMLDKTNIPFMKFKNIAFAVSAACVLLGIVAFVLLSVGKGNLGVDFTGGAVVQYKADKSFDLATVRASLDKAGIEGYTLQEVTGVNMLMVRLKKSEASVEDMEAKVTAAIKQGMTDAKLTVEGKTEIGAAVSKDLKTKAIVAILISLGGILLYLAFRFDISFGVAAAIATFHDVLAVLGFMYILGYEINLLIVTALLTVAGYSLTDTVVVFDRIRENIKAGLDLSFSDIINKSVNEMLARTILASGTTLVSAFAMWLWGGVVIHDFALSLVLGIVFGTYSSVFVASPLVYLWHKGKLPVLASDKV